MTTLARRLLVALLGLSLLGSSTGVGRVPLADAEEDEGRDYTPLRLSYVDGEVSFWRPGAEDWAPAQVNTPLAPGDELHTGNRGNVELQLGGQAFVRAWGDTDLGVVEQRSDVLQLKVTGGYLALDLRRLEPGLTVEVSAPHGALAVNAPGFYRVDVGPQRTAFTLRRGGRATLALADGTTQSVGAGERVSLDGTTVQRARVPEADVWDTWNEARTAHLVARAGARHVPSAVAGVADLDQYGTWRTEPSYGAVWVPSSVPEGWAPYSTGRWVADPHYGWTWVDTAPWGWAPYHYGRWVYVRGHWAWAPGPVVVRPVYAPALVAFFGSPGVSVAVGTPFVSWVALGWGEPVVPWWQASRFHGRPWWGGWGGPRVVNNVVVQRTTVINVNHITDYRNARIRRALVGVREDSFGRRAVHEVRLSDADLKDRRPIHGGLHVRPDRASFVAADGRGERPSEANRGRTVVTRRAPDRDGPDTSPRHGAPRPTGPAYGDDRRVPPRIGPSAAPGTPRRESPGAERDRGPRERDANATERDGVPAERERRERPAPPERRIGRPADQQRSVEPRRPQSVQPTPPVDPQQRAEPQRPVAPDGRVERERPSAPERRTERPADAQRQVEPRRPQPVRPAPPVDPQPRVEPQRPVAPDGRVERERPAAPERRPQPVQPERVEPQQRRVEPQRPVNPERSAERERPVAPQRPEAPQPVQPQRPVQPERRGDQTRREVPAREVRPAGAHAPAPAAAPAVDRARAQQPAARPQPGPARGERADERARESSETRPDRSGPDR